MLSLAVMEPAQRFLHDIPPTRDPGVMASYLTGPYDGRAASHLTF
jgi:hypothetical protein